jgi:hypothetical protein
VQELKASTDSPPCCPLPAGRLHEASSRLHNYTHCGRQSISRIIGGTEAVENEIPWMCAIMRFFEFFNMFYYV